MRNAVQPTILVPQCQFMCAVVCIIFAAWFLLSAIGQLPYVMRQGKQWRFLGLLPTWYFFNSPLATRDVYLLYRRQTAEGSFLEWQHLPLGSSRRWSNAFWSPERYLNKALLDVAALVITMRVRDRMEPQALQRSLPYGAALQLVRSRAAAANGQDVQFCLCVREAAQKAEASGIVLLSGVHRL
jgi:hypothetical protein